MPGRRTKLTFAAAVVVGALLVAGCGGTENHTWQGEFTERLEGASAAVEERLPELQPSAGREKMFIAGLEIGRTIGFKFALVKELDPPAGCEELQQKGMGMVGRMADLGGDLFKDMTPELERDLPAPFEEDIERIEEFEREAAHCATG
ncbi:MAG TPA: hypothetical protein VHS74_11330 [Solirubrobacterales bacterium]|jgi:hypothetical protein|nr:hypothetical protein [Solirubrobacterales bacterium]